MGLLICCLFCFVLRQELTLAQPDLELMEGLLPWPLQCEEYRHELPHPMALGFKFFLGLGALLLSGLEERKNYV